MIKKSVLIMVFKKEKFLLLRRSDKDTYAGKWEFPAGGMEKGEKAEQSAKRELFEETGIIRDRVGFVGLLERDAGDRHIIFSVFATDAIDDVISISDEHDRFGFFSDVPENTGIDTINALALWKGR